MQDYLVLITQLEYEYLTHPTFSLSTLFYHIQPFIHTFTLISEFVDLDLSGGAFINALSDLIKCNSGDQSMINILSLLLDDCTIPYLHTTFMWMTKGVLPQNHYMLKKGYAWNDLVHETDHTIYEFVELTNQICKIGMFVTIGKSALVHECPTTLKAYLFMILYFI